MINWLELQKSEMWENINIKGKLRKLKMLKIMLKIREDSCL